MVAIQIDEQTAATLQNQAKAAGLTVADYLRTLVPSGPSPNRPTWDELEAEFLSHSTSENSLPPDFARADIYSDHN
jgi:hypothetical protein